MSSRGLPGAGRVLVALSSLAAAEDIPSRRFDFPRTEKQLMSRDARGKRKYAWMVFEGITWRQKDGQEPILRSWKQETQIFGGTAAARVRNQFRAAPEMQFGAGVRLADRTQFGCDNDLMCQLVFFNAR
jgi:hypothetical protein